MLADYSNRYTSYFAIYTGKRHTLGQGFSYDVVSSLMDSSFLGRGYHLYGDNFYMSPKLFRDLYASSFVAGEVNGHKKLKCALPYTKPLMQKHAQQGNWEMAGKKQTSL